MTRNAISPRLATSTFFSIIVSHPLNSELLLEHETSVLAFRLLAHTPFQPLDMIIAGAVATATNAARATLIRSNGTKGRPPCARATAKGSLVTKASQVTPRA